VVAEVWFLLASQPAQSPGMAIINGGTIEKAVSNGV
jgi:hypothetical protein